MNRFRKLGFIDYSDRIQVHKSLLNVVLHDQLPRDRTEDASVLESHQKMEKFPD
jgi:CRP/FNR family cyclic AMP-dependent transcriptional regulator